MKKKLIACFLLLCLAGFTSSASALVLNFDDIELSNHRAYLQDGYGGLTWDMMAVFDAYGGSAYQNSAVSGNQFAFNAFAQVATAGGEAFDFNGAYFSAGWKESLDIQLTGYLNGEELFTDVINVSNREAVWHSFDYTGIDSLSFYSYSDIGNPDLNHFAMDNFTINETQAAPVPEPSTLFLLGLGMIGVARRRRIKA